MAGWDRKGRGAGAAGWIGGGALVVATFGLVYALAPEGAPRAPAGSPRPEAAVAAEPDDLAAGQEFSCTVARIVDGDTLVCSEPDVGGKAIRIRLSGISARERDGSCRSGHPCPEATAEAATATLERLAAGQVLACTGTNRTYDRIAAFCRLPDGVDLSCAMVESGTASVWPRHWRDHSCG